MHPLLFLKSVMLYLSVLFQTLRKSERHFHQRWECSTWTNQRNKKKIQNIYLKNYGGIFCLNQRLWRNQRHKANPPYRSLSCKVNKLLSKNFNHWGTEIHMSRLNSIKRLWEVGFNSNSRCNEENDSWMPRRLQNWQISKPFTLI